MVTRKQREREEGSRGQDTTPKGRTPVPPIYMHHHSSHHRAQQSLLIRMDSLGYSSRNQIIAPPASSVKELLRDTSHPNQNGGLIYFLLGYHVALFVASGALGSLVFRYPFFLQFCFSTNLCYISFDIYCNNVQSGFPSLKILSVPLVPLATIELYTVSSFAFSRMSYCWKHTVYLFLNGFFHLVTCI